MRRILFLDIDGVVLPLSQPTQRRYEDYPTDRIPEPLNRLVALLDEHPSIELVLSSSWRVDLGMERARELLPVRHRARLVGATPVIGRSANRGLECQHWLAEQDEPSIFAAVDDCRQLFAADTDWLVLVDARTGITDDAITLLKHRLELFPN